MQSNCGNPTSSRPAGLAFWPLAKPSHTKLADATWPSVLSYICCAYGDVVPWDSFVQWFPTRFVGKEIDPNLFAYLHPMEQRATCSSLCGVAYVDKNMWNDLCDWLFTPYEDFSQETVSEWMQSWFFGYTATSTIEELLRAKAPTKCMCVHCSDKHKGLYTLSLLNEDMIPEHITIGHHWPHEIGYWATSPEGSLVYYFGTHGQGCGWYTLAGNQEEPSHYFTTMADLMSSYHNPTSGLYRYYLDNNIPPPTSTPSTNMDVESDDL